MQGAKTYWFKYWKAHDLFKKVIFKVYSETLKTIFFSDEKKVKVTQLYNSHNELVYAPQKMRKIELPEERLFWETEAFSKQIMVSVAIPKAGKTSIFCWISKVNVKYYCNVLLKKMIADMNKLANHNEDLFMQDGATSHTD